MGTCWLWRAITGMASTRGETSGLTKWGCTQSSKPEKNTDQSRQLTLTSISKHSDIYKFTCICNKFIHFIHCDIKMSDILSTHIHIILDISLTGAWQNTAFTHLVDKRFVESLLFILQQYKISLLTAGRRAKVWNDDCQDIH